MVINYYYPLAQRAVDVMSSMSLGQRKRKGAGMGLGGEEKDFASSNLNGNGVFRNLYSPS